MATRDETRLTRRADARRNADVLRTVAREVFEEAGPGISVSDVARRAQLGIGTVYRHFPNKAALMEEIAMAVMSEAVEFSRRMREQEEDPWQRFRVVFLHMATVRSTELFPLSRGGGQPSSAALLEVRSDLVEELAAVVGAAQKAGAMRRDVNAHDVVLALNSVPPLRPRAGGLPGVDHAERQLRLLLDGFRAPGVEQMPGPPPSRDDVDAFFRAVHDL